MVSRLRIKGVINNEAQKRPKHRGECFTKRRVFQETQLLDELQMTKERWKMQ